MCVDPVSLSFAAGAIGAVGNMIAGFSKKQEADANAAALENNALQRQEKAKFDIERADVKYRRVTGSTVAKIGSTGVDVSSFSDVLADDAKESALEKKAIQVSADIDSANLRFQAAGQRSQGQAALVTGIFGAASSVVSAGTGYQKIKAYQAGSEKLGGVAIDDN